MITRKDMFVHDMIHNNPGLARYESNYTKPEFLRERGYDAMVFEIFDCAQFALLWDKLDCITGRTKIYPIGSEERRWAERTRQKLKKMYQNVKNNGLQVYFMMDIIVLPVNMKEQYPEILNEKGKIDILKPMMKTIFDCMFDEMFEEFPEIDGIYVRYGETYVGACYHTPYHCGNDPIQGDGWAYHKFLIEYLQDMINSY